MNGFQNPSTNPELTARIRAFRDQFEQVQRNVGRVIVGKDAVIDSLGMVSLIVEIEQLLETEHDVSVTLANDRAMSERNSPFRTVGVLADHVMSLIAQAQAKAA